MDEADRAQIEREREEERIAANALARAARTLQPRENCLYCDEPIDGLRRDYGCCIDCARAREQQHQLFGGGR